MQSDWLFYGNQNFLTLRCSTEEPAPPPSRGSGPVGVKAYNILLESPQLYLETRGNVYNYRFRLQCWIDEFQERLQQELEASHPLPPSLLRPCVPPKLKADSLEDHGAFVAGFEGAQTRRHLPETRQDLLAGFHQTILDDRSLQDWQEELEARLEAAPPMLISQPRSFREGEGAYRDHLEINHRRETRRANLESMMCMLPTLRGLRAPRMEV